MHTPTQTDRLRNVPVERHTATYGLTDSYADSHSHTQTSEQTRRSRHLTDYLTEDQTKWSMPSDLNNDSFLNERTVGLNARQMHNPTYPTNERRTSEIIKQPRILNDGADFNSEGPPVNSDRINNSMLGSNALEMGASYREVPKTKIKPTKRGVLKRGEEGRPQLRRK